MNHYQVGDKVLTPENIEYIILSYDKYCWLGEQYEIIYNLSRCDGYDINVKEEKLRPATKKFKKGDLVKITNCQNPNLSEPVWIFDSYNDDQMGCSLYKQHPYYKCITSSFIIVDIRDIEPYEDKELKPYSNERNLKLSYEVKSFIEILESLNKSCNKAGGCGFELKELEQISAADLLATLCTNNIRFTVGGV